MSTASGRAVLPEPGNEGMEALRALDDDHRGSGHWAGLGAVDGRDSAGVGVWLMARPLAWRLGVQAAAIDPSAAFRKALLSPATSMGPM